MQEECCTALQGYCMLVHSFVLIAGTSWSLYPFAILDAFVVFAGSSN